MTNHFVECTYLIFLLLKKLLCFCLVNGFSLLREMHEALPCMLTNKSWFLCLFSVYFHVCRTLLRSQCSQNMSCSSTCCSSGGSCSSGGHNHLILAPSGLWPHVKLSDTVIQRLPDLAAVISLTCKILPLRDAWFWLPSLAELSTWLPQPLKSTAEVF